MEAELTSSQVFFVTNDESIHILGGGENQSVEQYRENDSSNPDE